MFGICDAIKCRLFSDLFFFSRFRWKNRDKRIVFWLTVRCQSNVDDDVFVTTANHLPKQPANSIRNYSFLFFSIQLQLAKSRNTYINMEPKTISLANVTDFYQWIECTKNSCASRCTDIEWNFTFCFVSDNFAFKFTGNHAAIFVRFDHNAIVGTQTTNGSAWFHRIMTLVGRKHDQFARQTLVAVLLVAWEHSMTSRKESVQIRDRTAWRKNWVATIPTDDFAHFRQNNVFHENEHWRNFIREHVRVGRCRQPFASHRDNVQSRRQLIEEMRMTWNEKLMVSMRNRVIDWFSSSIKQSNKRQRILVESSCSLKSHWSRKHTFAFHSRIASQGRVNNIPSRRILNREQMSWNNPRDLVIEWKNAS